MKCCLNYELETYLGELKDIPTLEKPLETEKGPVHLQKTDIFRKLMWFAYEKENTWHPLSVRRVNEIIKLNAAGKKASSLEEEKEKQKQAVSKAISSELDRLDKKYSSRSRKSRKKKRRKPR